MDFLAFKYVRKLNSCLFSMWNSIIKFNMCPRLVNIRINFYLFLL